MVKLSDTDLVSAHAVTRFCQRVLDVAEIGGFDNAGLEMRAHCDAAGLPANKIRAMILTDRVRFALQVGTGNVVEELFIAVVRGGKVLTINPRESVKKKTKRMTVFDRNELRRKGEKLARRMR